MSLKEKHLAAVEDSSIFEQSMQDMLKKVTEDTTGACWDKEKVIKYSQSQFDELQKLIRLYPRLYHIL